MARLLGGSANGNAATALAGTESRRSRPRDSDRVSRPRPRTGPDRPGARDPIISMTMHCAVLVHLQIAAPGLSGTPPYGQPWHPPNRHSSSVLNPSTPTSCLQWRTSPMSLSTSRGICPPCSTCGLRLSGRCIRRHALCLGLDHAPDCIGAFSARNMQISVKEAIDLHATEAVKLTEEEDARGRILPGYLADLTVGPRHPLTESVSDLRDLQPKYTIMAGKSSIPDT